MIGKQTKGTSFGGCVRYVLKKEKSKLLEAVGIEGTPEQMAEQFELQALLNDKVKNIVGHTSLNFSPEDGECLKSDDALMLQIACNSNCSAICSGEPFTPTASSNLDFSSLRT